MHVAIVDWDISYPANSGKRLRTLNLMLRLTSRHRITYFGRGRASSPEAIQAAEFLGDHGIECVVIEHPLPAKSGLGFYARLAANVFSTEPYAAAVHRSSMVHQVLRQHAERDPVDLWQVEWTPYADAVRDLSGAAVVMAPNVDTLIWRRYFETARNPLKRWYISAQGRKFARMEQRVFRSATRVVAVSPDDARLVRELFGVDHVDVVDNGIDKAYYENVSGCRDPRRVLFLGSLDWRPNLDAVDLLLDRVFPLVAGREPAARLSIVGRSPPESLRQRVRGMDRVELHADVPDVRPFLDASGVLAVPLRIGGGSRLKILEALAAGLPVVSSRVGAEGLDLCPDQHLVVVDDEEQMANALLKALRNPAPLQLMAERGRAWVQERYDWSVLADKLEKIWEDCVPRSQHRAGSISVMA
jgi:glycosyltransferase involved in cell wall biosynthesis